MVPSRVYPVILLLVQIVVSLTETSCFFLAVNERMSVTYPAEQIGANFLNVFKFAL